ncbi:hypothetical protein A6F53_01815 [Levilactobacillus brevis]|uniref:DUF5776 domain-containing protein n=1 Tax=Levilactobacillus brevis TaxID=1580 RepID=UPI00041B4470|nr:DUF5776 domain-containing protein [Levilactobacillus brevis]ANN48045.1 hypothetical protein A6F53_01815 [Levilactobacillus brevis]ATU70333.1 hypothetical protein CT113_08315 [Levilactobacillus brevis]
MTFSPLNVPILLLSTSLLTLTLANVQPVTAHATATSVSLAEKTTTSTATAQLFTSPVNQPLTLTADTYPLYNDEGQETTDTLPGKQQLTTTKILVDPLAGTTYYRVQENPDRFIKYDATTVNLKHTLTLNFSDPDGSTIKGPLMFRMTQGNDFEAIASDLKDQYAAVIDGYVFNRTTVDTANPYNTQFNSFYDKAGGSSADESHASIPSSPLPSLSTLTNEKIRLTSPNDYSLYDNGGNNLTTGKTTVAGNSYYSATGLYLFHQDSTNADNVFYQISPDAFIKGDDTTALTSPITFKYETSDGQSIKTDSMLDTGLVTGDDLNNLIKELQTWQPTIDGYTYQSVNPTADTLTFKYTPTSASSSSDTSSSTSSSSQTSSSTSTDSTASSDTHNSVVTSASSTRPDKSIVPKGAAVTAIRKIGVYRDVQFTKQNRRHWYQRQPQTKRPQFVVTGYARTKAGTLRYQIRDVNHHSATDGQRGYITANSKFVMPTYYQAAPKRIKVISPHGVNAYRQINLTQKKRHYRVGTTITVKAIKSYHLTTRLVLSNGTYVTANKILVAKK